MASEDNFKEAETSSSQHQSDGSSLIFHNTWDERKNCANCTRDEFFALPFCAKSVVEGLAAWFSDTPTSSGAIPSVFTHEFWLSECVRPLARILDDAVDNLMEDSEVDFGFFEKIFAAFNELIRRVKRRSLERERINEFLDAFLALARCSEAFEAAGIRFYAQRTFAALLELFVPVAQFLLLCRVFELILERKIRLSKESHEPQLLAWLVDQFRQKAFSVREGVQLSEFFQSQLGRFYAQIEGIVYDDPLLGLNFSLSLLLLLKQHALSRLQTPLLKSIKVRILDRLQTQLADFVRLREIRLKAAEARQGSVLPLLETENESEDTAKWGFLQYTLKDTEKIVLDRISADGE